MKWNIIEKFNCENLIYFEPFLHLLFINDNDNLHHDSILPICPKYSKCFQKQCLILTHISLEYG